MLRFFEGFEIDDYTGISLSEDDIVAQYSTKIQQFQVINFLL